MFRIGLKSPKSFILRFINYYLKSVWATFPVSMSKHQYPVCAFISLDFLEIVQWTSQFLHTWVNLTTNNTGYSGVIICKWDWMLGWIVTRDWRQATVKRGMSSNQSRVMTCECQNKGFIKCYCKQNQTNNKFKHVKL